MGPGTIALLIFGGVLLFQPSLLSGILSPPAGAAPPTPTPPSPTPAANPYGVGGGFGTGSGGAPTGGPPIQPAPGAAPTGDNASSWLTGIGSALTGLIGSIGKITDQGGQSTPSPQGGINPPTYGGWGQQNPPGYAWEPPSGGGEEYWNTASNFGTPPVGGDQGPIDPYPDLINPWG